MKLASISNNTNASDQQRLLQQIRATQDAGATRISDASSAAASFAAIGHVQPPPPRPAPPPTTLPVIVAIPGAIDEDKTLSSSADSALTQRLAGVRSFLLTLQSVMPTTDTASSQSIMRTGAATGRTLLTI